MPAEAAKKQKILMLLYKYFPPDRESFLQKRLIRFTQPNILNDPFECLPSITGYGEKEAKEQADKVAMDMAFEIALGDLSNLHPQMTLDALNFCNAQVRNQYAADPAAVGLRYAAALLNNMSNQIGVLCLCENLRSILMWSHYARNHEGFVVGFESSDAFLGHRKDEPIEIGELRRVEYVKKRPSVSLAIIKNQDAIIPDFLFSKGCDWAYEQEWRIIRFLKVADPASQGDVYLFKVPSTAIRQVIFGCKASDSLKSTLLNAAKDPELAHVQFLKATLSRNDFEMDILPPDAPEPFNLALAWLKARDASKARR